MYRLNKDFVGTPYNVMVVGCGGTGGFAAEGLCRLLPLHVPLILVDHDRVERGNLSRQNFFPEEIGQVKSEALAVRLSRRYGRQVAYSVLPIGATKPLHYGIVVGCVDNGLARRDIAEKIGEPRWVWWVDAGNGDNFGQVLIGNCGEAYFVKKTETCYALPLPTLQRPELLSQAPARREPNCVQIAEQGPTINRVMASLVVEVVRRLIDGTCPWMQLILDMEMGELHPVMATPEAAERILGKKKVEVNEKE